MSWLLPLLGLLSLPCTSSLPVLALDDAQLGILGKGLEDLLLRLATFHLCLPGPRGGKLSLNVFRRHVGRICRLWRHNSVHSHVIPVHSRVGLCNQIAAKLVEEQNAFCRLIFGWSTRSDVAICLVEFHSITPSSFSCNSARKSSGGNDNWILFVKRQMAKPYDL